MMKQAEAASTLHPHDETLIQFRFARDCSGLGPESHVTLVRLKSYACDVHIYTVKDKNGKQKDVELPLESMCACLNDYEFIKIGNTRKLVRKKKESLALEIASRFRSFSIRHIGLALGFVKRAAAGIRGKWRRSIRQIQREYELTNGDGNVEIRFKERSK